MRKIVYEKYFFDQNLNLSKNTQKDILFFEPTIVRKFSDLVRACAQISTKYRECLIYYRGQENHYTEERKEKGKTIKVVRFQPSFYRKLGKIKKEKEFTIEKDFEKRNEILKKSIIFLIEEFKKSSLLRSNSNLNLLKKFNELSWSIIQHYEIFPTPLLDLTQSLNVACSFALNKNKNEGYVYLFGLPLISNRITYNTDQEIVIVRLLSICPPEAIRPYYQDGYLVGTFPFSSSSTKFNKESVDINKRLVYSFKLEVGEKNNFFDIGNRINRAFLMPEVKTDQFIEHANNIRKQLVKNYIDYKLIMENTMNLEILNNGSIL